MPGEPVSGLVGRARELAALRTALAQADAGRSRLLLVTGEPGIGKSALVDAFASQAGADGARVVWGAAWEDGGAPAYWPWVQVLRQLAPELAQLDVATHGLAPLGRLVPELAVAEADTFGAEGERFALFDAVARALALASRPAPLVVILEDLHAAGLPSALLLQFVAQHVRGAPVLLVVTYRDVEARLAPGLGEIVAALEAAGTVLALPAMSEPEVRDLVAPVMPDVPVDVLTAIMERTRGNPLFVAQVARLLALEPAGTAVASQVPIPAGIRQAVRERLERLAGSAELPRVALTVGAVLGGDVDLGDVAAVLDSPMAELLEALGPAVRSGLLVELGPQRYRFAHALVREAIYGDLESTERATLHHQVATVLAERRDRAGDHARLAHHFHAALPVGGAGAAVHHATAAGREAMAALAYEEAVGLFQQALSALHHTTGDRTEQRCELLLALGSALVVAGDLGRAQPVLVQATEHARRCGRGELLARAALVRTKHLAFHMVDHDAIELLEEAVAALDGSATPILAQVYTQLGFALHHEPERMAAITDRAIEVAGRGGDVAALAAAMSMRLHSRWGRHDPRAALAEAEELTRLAEQSGDPGLAATAHEWRFTSALELGEPVTARGASAALQELAERSRQPFLRLVAASRAATLATLTGEVEEALALIDDAWQIGRRAQLPDAEGVHWAQLFGVWRFVGLSAEDEARMMRISRDLAARSERPVPHRAAVVLFDLSHGAHTEAADRLRSLVEQVPALPHDPLYLWSLGMVAEACVALDATGQADVLYTALAPFSGRFVVVSGVACLGAVDHYLAGLAALAGRLDDAARHYEAAIDQHRRADATPMVARSCQEYAALLRRRGAPGDEQRAQALAVEAPGPAGSVQPVRGEEVATPSEPEGELRRSGRTWHVRWEGAAATVPDSKGMRDLAVLLAAPEREVPVLDLVEAAGGPGASAVGGHAGERLDRTARTAYRRRLADMEEELAAAEAEADLGRVEALRREQEFLVDELAGAMGLGGRVRTDGDPVERARKAVSMRIRRAVEAIAEVSPSLARHLDRSVTTGRLCAYRPERPVRWRL